MLANQEEHHHHHFLIVTYPVHSHISPALHLAKRLALTTTGTLIAFSTAVSAHRKMFSNLDSADQEFSDGVITYIPFSDGLDEGFTPGVEDSTPDFVTQSPITCARNLSSIIDELNSRGPPITCVIYTLMVPWVAKVAEEHGIPWAHYWIQPATVFAIYYHFFHGYDAVIADVPSTVELPGLPPLQFRELPTFVTALSITDTHPISFFLDKLKKLCTILDGAKSGQKPKVLVNTCDELESDVLAAVDGIELIAVGPLMQSVPKRTDHAKASSFDLFKFDKKGYMEWLDTKPDRSVVYVSFGSISVLKKQEIEEILQGLKESGKPYLWVVRKDCRYEGLELEDENGMVVEWCSQVSVLAHPSVGCFVTHCGWNSTIESLVCGVPTVGVPQWSDQTTNAMLMEKVWGNGVRAEVNGEGVLERRELRSCLDLVMENGERGAEIRRKAEFWKEKTSKAISEGGSSYRNIQMFMDELAKSSQS